MFFQVWQYLNRLHRPTSTCTWDKPHPPLHPPHSQSQSAVFIKPPKEFPSLLSMPLLMPMVLEWGVQQQAFSPADVLYLQRYCVLLITLMMAEIEGYQWAETVCQWASTLNRVQPSFSFSNLFKSLIKADHEVPFPTCLNVHVGSRGGDSLLDELARFKRWIKTINCIAISWCLMFCCQNRYSNSWLKLDRIPIESRPFQRSRHFSFLVTFNRSWCTVDRRNRLTVGVDKHRRVCIPTW